MIDKLTGKTCIVTISSRGIGEVFYRFSRNGAIVYFVAT